MERVAVDFWRWPRRECSADIRSDLGQANNPESFRGQKRRNPSGASHSSISTVSYEFSRLFFNRCFSGKLRRGSAHPETSNGGYDNHRLSERPVCLEGYWWRHSDDDLVLPHAWIAAAIRSELSLSIPGFERDLHHADGSGRAKRKAKRATYHWRFANQCRHRARFTQLATTPYGGRSSATPDSRSSPLQKIHAPDSTGHNLSKVPRLISWIRSAEGSWIFG